jgi:hypothetical protein
MDEYYGLNERKILNKYELWRQYIKNLKMKKNFDERSRDGHITHNKEKEKTESKDEMIQRYTAFLSKKWFSKADPFLKAKYKDYFQESEVKWGPNMIFKKLHDKTAKLNQAKYLVEQRLNKETTYAKNRTKGENSKKNRRDSSNSGKSTCDEDYEKFFKLSHKEMCKYCSLNGTHLHSDNEIAHFDNFSQSMKICSHDSFKSPQVSKKVNLLPKISERRKPRETSIKKLHHKLSLKGDQFD